jgi:hypothetical protein
VNRRHNADPPVKKNKEKQYNKTKTNITPNWTKKKKMDGGGAR